MARLTRAQLELLLDLKQRGHIWGRVAVVDRLRRMGLVADQFVKNVKCHRCKGAGELPEYKLVLTPEGEEQVAAALETRRD